MNYRIADILGYESHKVAGTQIIDLNVANPITRIEIMAVLTGITVPPTSHPMNAISKIELVDGSNVLYSLSGMQAQAIDFYDGSKQARGGLAYCGAFSSQMNIGINFGRFLYDPVLAFDPKKFTNPQLKITHNFAGAGGANDNVAYSIKAHIFDEKAVTPIGFLMNKEIRSYTGVQDGYSYTDLPTDYPLRSLYIQARVADTWWGSVFVAAKLSEDTDKRIPLDVDTGYLAEVLGQMFGPWREKTIINLDIGPTEYEVTPNTNISLTGATANGIAIQRVQGEFGCTLKLGGVTDPGDSDLYVDGYLPHGVFIIPFGARNEIDDWYDVSKIGKLELRTKGANALTAVKPINIITQQLRKYAA